MAAPEKGPHRICRAGLHCLALTGITYDGRCLMCRRDSHRKAQSRYASTSKEPTVRSRYNGTAKGMLTKLRDNAKGRSS